MDIKYSPKDLEASIYKKWIDNDCFSAKDLKSNYSIVLPPPNVTGTLHMGHAFQHTIIDILIRYNRMLGKSVLWQPGTDHAGIATQLVVENNLAREGKTRHDIGRKSLVDEIWKWKEKSGNTIISQTKRIGSSADWDRNRFTMDDGLSDAVKKVFITLYNEDIIYRGNRLINWDIKLQTAISDLEVTNIEKVGHLYNIKYEIEDSNELLIVATTRPETLFGDTAICVNPNDERYKRFINKKAKLPLTNRLIKIISDDSIDMDFGTGCVKITPAHDFNDYKLGKKHNLEFINILNKDGTLNNNVNQKFRGIGIHESRELIVNELKNIGLLGEIEDYKTTVPIGERSGEIVEPLLTDQWFMKMEDLAKPAIDAVKNSNIKFVPKNWEKIYFNWLDNIEDWCISRQIWWGHRIPAWFDKDNNIYVGNDENEIREKYNINEDAVLTQDNDVLDTWFSSALWPFTTLGWPEKTKELERYYPTSVLVTGFDIIFFWVARMVMMGIKFLDMVPFKTIYIHGLVRDSEGKKMSKSVGNVIDPIDIIDGIGLDALTEKRVSSLVQPKLKNKIIKKTKDEFPEGIQPYGADALRFCFCALGSTGRDISFDLKRIEGYRNFCNKLWNASRFVYMTTNGYQYQDRIKFDDLTTYEKFMIIKLDALVTEYKKHCTSYRFDLMANSLYSFIWNEYCDWFVEISKVEIDNGNEYTKNVLIYTLQIILKLCHPIIPYITEEIWREMNSLGYTKDEILMNAKFPSQQKIFKDGDIEAEVLLLKEFITKIRKTRSDLNVHPKIKIDIYCFSKDSLVKNFLDSNNSIICSLLKAQNIFINEESFNVNECITVSLENLKVYIPIKKIIDIKKERERLIKNMSNLESNLLKIEGKLNNKNFIEKAPSEIIQSNFNKQKFFEKEIASVKDLLECLSD
ncbi:MAG: valine--tRNA ligase [Gammaproteobacteria bacterium]|nr:valine--tRNA ligase [Gammaproteobacteria bacterium]